MCSQLKLKLHEYSVPVAAIQRDRVECERSLGSNAFSPQDLQT
jgi:hypothetical protein